MDTIKEVKSPDAKERITLARSYREVERIKDTAQKEPSQEGFWKTFTIDLRLRKAESSISVNVPGGCSLPSRKRMNTPVSSA